MRLIFGGAHVKISFQFFVQDNCGKGGQRHVPYGTIVFGGRPDPTRPHKILQVLRKIFLLRAICPVCEICRKIFRFLADG